MCCTNIELSLLKFVRYVKKRQYAIVSLNKEIYRIPTLQYPVLPATAVVLTVWVLTVFFTVLTVFSFFQLLRRATVRGCLGFRGNFVA